uniref:siderophore-iron reductase FhuF n=1 Tax=Pseudomonas laurentiana TaxID=2364649 RepID=UPI0029C9A7AD|nr:siderophore-iron reductase FhuF [Pseudomonas laurentiana]
MTQTVRLSELLRPAYFHRLLLALYGADLMPAQLPVLVSQWSKYYFSMFWREAVSARCAGRGLALPGNVGVSLDERGLPLAFEPMDAGSEDLQGLLEQHLAPLIQQLAALGSVSVAVLWGNAGDCLEQCLQALEVDLVEARDLLDRPGGPLFAAVSYDANGLRRRRTCCLSYKVAWVGHCAHCPLNP